MGIARALVGAICTLAILTGSASSATAQGAIVVGGGVQWDAQRFTQSDVPNRLDGSAMGWTAIAGARVKRHLALRAEWTDAGEISDTSAISVDVDGRVVTISSTFAHRTRSLVALGGYTHRAGSRARVAYLAGLALTSVRRTFSANAAGLILVSPSNTSTSGREVVDDTFVAFAGGLDALLGVSEHVHILAGVRAQSLAISPEQSGWSLRSFGGLAWAF